MGCPGSGASSPGDTGVLTLTESSESLTMVYGQDQASISFPTGTDDATPATLTTRFWTAETEFANAQAAAVLQWAYDSDRFSIAVGDHNGSDTTMVKHGGQYLLILEDADCRVDYDGSGNFNAGSGYKDNPVTNVTWYGAVMPCNWRTEMRDGNTDNVVYADIDTTWEDDETTEDTTMNGYPPLMNGSTQRGTLEQRRLHV